MSITTDLLNDLQTCLNNAYDSVGRDGGTVPASKTFANLPTAVNSIPEPVPPIHVPLYGLIEVCPWEKQTSTLGENVEVLSYDEYMLENFLINYPITDPQYPTSYPLQITFSCLFDEEDPENKHYWEYYDYTGSQIIFYSDEELYEQTGLRVQLFPDAHEQGWANAEVVISVGVDPSMYDQFDLYSPEDVAAFGGEAWMMAPMENCILKLPSTGFEIYGGAIKGFTVGTEITSIPDNFLRCLPSLESVYLAQSPITEIGNLFLQNDAGLTSLSALPSTLTTIGEGFLSTCENLNQPIVIPEGVTSIGQYFMEHCYNYDSDVTFPSTLASIGGGIMVQAYNMTSTVYFNGPATALYTPDTVSFVMTNATSPAYVNGITLDGTYAADWKTALPDLSTSSPRRYRKMILAS